jgi:hypothetical protein
VRAFVCACVCKREGERVCVYALVNVYGNVDRCVCVCLRVCVRE